MRARSWLPAVALLLVPRPAAAVSVLVGDIDGFGFFPPTGLVRAGATHDQPADVDDDGLIEPGEYLPDLNLNGTVAVGSGDDFDNRDSVEAAAGDGTQHTDRSLLNAAANANQFIFTFPVPLPGDFDHGVEHFINFVFGDYDVSPATITVDGTTVPLTVQGGGDDGLVQLAFAPVPFADLEDGEVRITVNAPNEPYLAFDYALLDTGSIEDTDGDGVPDGIDLCPDTADYEQTDRDDDGIGDKCDDCPDDPYNDADDDGWCGDVDCLDLDPNVNPDAEEVCDDLTDNDCDGRVDELGDVDLDGYDGCEDCDDLAADVNPGATEVCDGRDEDCSGLADDLPDEDGDGLGPCEGDCDDTDPSIHPDAAEACDGRDEDCSGTADDAPDADGDGLGPCEGDCDDSDPGVHPDLDEDCGDGVDNNCDRLEDADDTLCGAISGCACRSRIAAPSTGGGASLLMLLAPLALRRRRGRTARLS